MRILDLIEAKKSGQQLSPAQIGELISQYVAGDVPDYQMAALLMAIRWRGLDDDETVALTEAMVHSGSSFELSDLAGPRVDKHSTGGVGDKVSLVLAPLVACCGCLVPMVSGRGLGHTGGTLDKLETIPGMRTGLSAAAFRRQLETIGVAMGAQTEDFVPADRRLYALRDATGTVDDSGLITASILSKKIAEGCGSLVLDIKVGSGGFSPDLATADRLAKRLMSVATGAGLRCSALLTRMDRPLGRAVGTALEVIESLEALDGAGPPDLREVVLALGAEMLCLSGAAADAEAATARLEAALDDGSARERFALLVEAQGGDPEIVGNRSLLPTASEHRELTSQRGGVVQEISARAVGAAAIALCAGRDRRGDTIDPGAGLVFHLAPGDPVAAAQPWVTMHYGGKADAERAAELLIGALQVAEQPPPTTPLILETRR